MAEIAQGLEVSLSTTKRWLKRGVRQIEKRLDKDVRLSDLLKGRRR